MTSISHSSSSDVKITRSLVKRKKFVPPRPNTSGEEKQIRVGTKRKYSEISSTTATSLTTSYNKFTENLQLNSTQSAGVPSSSSTSTSSSTQKKKKAKSALVFIQQAKETLEPVEYKTFQSYIRQYKQKNLSIEGLVDHVTTLFDCDQKRHLLHGFGTFIPPKYKSTYNNLLISICQKNTTKSSISKESNDGNDNNDDNDDIMNDDHPTKIREDPEKNAHTTTTSSTICTSVITSTGPSSSSSSCSKAKALSSTVALAEQKNSVSCVESSADQKEEKLLSQPASQIKNFTLGNSYDLITGKPKKSKKRPKVMIQTKSEPILENQSKSESKQEEEEEEDSDQEVDDYLDHAKAGNGIKCTICQSSAVAPFNARCGHICCKSCWDQWLANQLTCPVCRERVRQKQLTKLYFC